MEGDTGLAGTIDKKVRIPIGAGQGVSSSTINKFTVPENNLIKFNKDYYINTESIVFAIQMYSSDATVYGIVDYLIRN